MSFPAIPLGLIPKGWRRVREYEKMMKGDITLCFNDPDTGEQCEPHWAAIQNFRAPWGDELVIRRISVKGGKRVTPLRKEHGGFVATVGRKQEVAS